MMGGGAEGRGERRATRSFREAAARYWSRASSLLESFKKYQTCGEKQQVNMRVFASFLFIDITRTTRSDAIRNLMVETGHATETVRFRQTVVSAKPNSENVSSVELHNAQREFASAEWKRGRCLSDKRMRDIKKPSHREECFEYDDVSSSNYSWNSAGHRSSRVAFAFAIGMLINSSAMLLFSLSHSNKTVPGAPPRHCRSRTTHRWRVLRYE